jgi:hypothetical protein
MNSHSFLCAILLTAVSAFCQPSDVDGWNKVKWGMTIAEAKAAYGADVEDSQIVPGPNFVEIDRLTIKAVEIGSIRATASIQTKRNSDKVNSVVVNVAEVREDPGVRADRFDTVRTLLIQKYGTPKNEDRKPDGDNLRTNVVWTFPSTSITLLWVEGRRYRHGYVTITYEAVDERSLDVL